MLLLCWLPLFKLRRIRKKYVYSTFAFYLVLMVENLPSYIIHAQIYLVESYICCCYLFACVKRIIFFSSVESNLEIRTTTNAHKYSGHHCRFNLFLQNNNMNEKSACACVFRLKKRRKKNLFKYTNKKILTKWYMAIRFFPLRTLFLTFSLKISFSIFDLFSHSLARLMLW